MMQRKYLLNPHEMNIVDVMLLLKLTLALNSVLVTSGNIVGVTVNTNDWSDLQWLNISHTDILPKDESNVTIHISDDRNILDITQSVTKSVDKSYLGYIHFTNCRFATVLDLLLSRLNITNVLIVKQPCYINNPGSTTLKLFTSCQWTTRMMTDIVLHLPWNSLLVFYDDTVDDKCVRDLLTLFSSNSVRCQLCNIDVMIKENNIKEVNQFSQTRILVFASYEKTRQLLQASKINESEHTRYWVIYVYDLDGKPLDEMETMDNVVLIRQPFPKLTHGTTMYTEESSVTLAYLRAALKVLQNGTEIHKNIGENGYLRDIEYKVYKNSTAASVEIGLWDSVIGLNWKTEELIFDTIFTDFGHRHLKIATQEAKPFTMKTGNKTEFTGFCIDILNELANGFKFSYTLVEPPDGLWGAPNADGSWNGMVGMVRRGEVDFAVGPFTITSLRETVIDFTTPYMEDGAGILTKRPTGENSKMFKMFEPFSELVWVSIAVAILVVGVMLYISNRFSPYGAFYQSDSLDSKDEVKLSKCLWLIYGSFMEQANLAAFLTVTIAEKPINSLKELVAHEELQPLVKIGTNLHSLFEKSEGGIYGEIWDKMSSMPEVRDSATALKMVKNGLFAFMTDRTQLEYVLLQDCETYALADEIFNTAGYGFVLPEKAPFIEVFDKHLMRMQEAGLMEKWRKKWWSSKSECTNTGPTSSAQALGLDSLSGLFFFYGGVIGVSFICLVIEICVLNRCRRKDRKNHTNSSVESDEIKLDTVTLNSVTSISKDTNRHKSESNVPKVKKSNRISIFFSSLYRRK